MSEYGQTQKREYRARAARALGVPPELRPYEYEVVTVRTGEEALASQGITMHDVLIEPRHILSNDAYDGGNPLALDPFHPATRMLVALRVAEGTGIPGAIHSAIIAASHVLQEHGVPAEIIDAYAIGHRAEEFSSLDVVAVMPDLADLEPWRDRAQAAYEMIGAQVGIPFAHPRRRDIWDYTWCLSNPEVPDSLLEEHVQKVLDALPTRLA